MAVNSIALLKQTYFKLCQNKACARLILENKPGQCFATLSVKEVAGDSKSLVPNCVKSKPSKKKRKSPSTLRRNYERAEKFRIKKNEASKVDATKSDEIVSSEVYIPAEQDSNVNHVDAPRGQKRNRSSTSSDEAAFSPTPIPQIDGWENPIPGWSLPPRNPPPRLESPNPSEVLSILSDDGQDAHVPPTLKNMNQQNLSSDSEDDLEHSDVLRASSNAANPRVAAVEAPVTVDHFAVTEAISSVTSRIDMDNPFEGEKEYIKRRLALAKTKREKTYFKKEYDKLFDKSVEDKPKCDSQRVTKILDTDDEHLEDIIHSDFFKGLKKNR